MDSRNGWSRNTLSWKGLMRNTESNSRPCTGAPQHSHHIPRRCPNSSWTPAGLWPWPPAFSSYYWRCFCTLLNPSVSTLGLLADHLHRHVPRCHSSSTNTGNTGRSHGLTWLCTHLYSREGRLRCMARHVFHAWTLLLEKRVKNCKWLRRAVEVSVLLLLGHITKDTCTLPK